MITKCELVKEFLKLDDFDNLDDIEINDCSRESGYLFMISFSPNWVYIELTNEYINKILKKYNLNATFKFDNDITIYFKNLESECKNETRKY